MNKSDPKVAFDSFKLTNQWTNLQGEFRRIAWSIFLAGWSAAHDKSKENP